MTNLKDEKTKIYPSTTRGGKELPFSYALDSPSVLSKLVRPKPASPIRSDMSHVIDDATSTMRDAYDDTTSLLDNIVPLGEFLYEHLARARENEIIETDNIDESDDEDSPPRYELLLCLRVMLWMKKLLEIFLIAMIDLVLRSY